MANYNQAPKQTRAGKRLAVAIAACALPLTGCGISTEQQAIRDTTDQVFADVIAGKQVTKDPFGNKTFTISLEDKYPGITQKSEEDRKSGTVYTYIEGQKRMATAYGMSETDFMLSGELEAKAVCNTAAVNGLLTEVDRRTVQNKWDYYIQLGGQKAVDGYDSSAESAISDISFLCGYNVMQGMKHGAEVTFVPAMNK